MRVKKKYDEPTNFCQSRTMYTHMGPFPRHRWSSENDSKHRALQPTSLMASDLRSASRPQLGWSAHDLIFFASVSLRPLARYSQRSTPCRSVDGGLARILSPRTAEPMELLESKPSHWLSWLDPVKTWLSSRIPSNRRRFIKNRVGICGRFDFA